MKHQEFALRSEFPDHFHRTSIRANVAKLLISILFIKVHPVRSRHPRFAFQVRGRTINSLSSKHLRERLFRKRHVLSELALPSDSGCKPLPRMYLRPVGVSRIGRDLTCAGRLSGTVIALPPENPPTAPQSSIARSAQRTSVRRITATHCNRLSCVSSIWVFSIDFRSGCTEPAGFADKSGSDLSATVSALPSETCSTELHRISHFRPTKSPKSTIRRGLRGERHLRNESLVGTGLIRDNHIAHFRPTSSHFNPSFSHLVLRNVALESDFSCHVPLQFVSCRHL